MPAVVPASEFAIRFVIARLRNENARELFARRPIEDSPAARMSLASEILRALERGPVVDRCAFYAGQNPAAVLLSLGDLCCCRDFIAMTDQWPAVARTVYRFGKRLLSARARQGFRRCETSVLAGGDMRWLLRLGFKVEGPEPVRGKNGETFLRLAWSPEESDVRFQH